MDREKGFRIAILTAVAVAIGLGSWVMVSGRGGHGWGEGRWGHGSGWGHGRFGEHLAMLKFINQLDLSDEQQQHIEKMHEIMESHRSHIPEMRTQGLDWMLGALEEGEVDGGEVRQKLDAHVEQFRDIAYEVSDEFVALINSLDERQRGLLAEHLEEAKSDEGRHWGGRRRF